VKETFLDTIRGAGGEAEDRARAEDRGKKGEEEVEAKLGGVSVNSSFTLLHVFVMHMRDQEMSSLKQLPFMEQDWYPKKRPEPQPLPGESSFAASNSSLIKLRAGGFAFATGGASEQPRVIGSYCYLMGDYMPCHTKVSSVPMTSSPSGGIFSLASREFSDHCQSDEDWKKTMDRAEQNPWPLPPCTVSVEYRDSRCRWRLQ
jgi:hypothetical protein